jgi:hypothetical protein
MTDHEVATVQNAKGFPETWTFPTAGRTLSIFAVSAQGVVSTFPDARSARWYLETKKKPQCLNGRLRFCGSV